MKTNITLVLLSCLVALALGGCDAKTEAPIDEIRVSVFYPRKDGARFDWQYYTQQHLPLVRDRFGPALKELSIDEGLAGGAKDSPPAFVAVAHMTFASIESFQTATAPHVAEVMADIPKFTTIEPIIQVSRIKSTR